VRPPSDLPQTPRPASSRRRRWIIAGIIIAIVVIASLRTFAIFYTDALWFSSVNLHTVWVKLFEIKVGLMVVFASIFAVLLLASLLVADAALAQKIKVGYWSSGLSLGQGAVKVEMSFLPSTFVPCETCRGRRYNPETLEVRYNEKSIADVLDLTIEQAVDFFADVPRLQRPLALLRDTGLGYLTLGQRSPTLSGGEAQRIKLVTELSKVRIGSDDAGARPGRSGAQKHTLYVLDEPTVGLHMADVEKLIHVLHRLVDAGNTVVVIEHNLDVMGDADWIIDLGPEGGDGGGRIVMQGTPPSFARNPDRSHTSRVLAEFLAERSVDNRALAR